MYKAQFRRERMQHETAFLFEYKRLKSYEGTGHSAGASVLLEFI